MPTALLNETMKRELKYPRKRHLGPLGKVCRVCGKDKWYYYENFTTGKFSSTQCASCTIRRSVETRRRRMQSDPNFAREYGWKTNGIAMTVQEYDIMLEKQNGVCAICNTQPHYRLYVDHDHETGLVRGLLCARCNSMAGSTTERLRAVLAYVESFT